MPPQAKPEDKSAGRILAEARIAKHLELIEVSKATKIHVHILTAIEAGDFTLLSPVYAKSFIKLYAGYLGIDTADLLAGFKDTEAAGPAGTKNGTRTSNKTSAPSILVKIFSKNNVKVLAALGIGVFLFMQLSSRGFKKWSRPSKPAGASLAKSVGPPLRVRPKEIPPAAAAEDPEKKIVLVIRAKEKCWLQVKADGRTVFQNTLGRGSAESWQAGQKLELWLGNAAGVQLELNGRILDKIGRPGQTPRHITITKSGLTVQR